MSYDPRFDEAEAEVDKGNPWMFKEADAPNPLTIEVEEWVEITTTFGPADLMIGRDRNRKRWSVLVGEKATVLRKGLIEGLVEGWNDEKKHYEVIETLGKVQAGEVVSLFFDGQGEGANGPYNKFKISRRAAIDGIEADGKAAATATDDDIPFDDGVPD